jgi:hypothetical protein
MPSKTKVLVYLGSLPKPVYMDSDLLFKVFSPAILQGATWFEKIKTTTFMATVFVRLRFRTLGGKGGFGSQLRAQGNKMSSKKRAGDFSSCRDLTGKRIRTTSQNQKIEEHLGAVEEHKNFLKDRTRSKMESIVKKAPLKMDTNFLSKHHENTETIETIVTKTFTNGQKPRDPGKDNERHGLSTTPITPWLE